MSKRLYIIGNSHAWTVIGWEQVAARDSVAIQNTADGLEMRGIAITGATAHNLIEDHSSTMAGPKVQSFLDSFSDDKDVLLIFGDIDLRRHITGQDGLRNTVERYRHFIRGISQRPDVRRVLVGSATGYHGVLPQPMTDHWNVAIAELCTEEGWAYVDLTTPGLGIRQLEGRTDENHLDPSAGTLLRAAILERLER